MNQFTPRETGGSHYKNTRGFLLRNNVKMRMNMFVTLDTFRTGLHIKEDDVINNKVNKRKAAKKIY